MLSVVFKDNMQSLHICVNNLAFRMLGYVITYLFFYLIYFFTFIQTLNKIENFVSELSLLKKQISCKHLTF